MRIVSRNSILKTVSVIIPTYNYGRFIREAINSVLAQTYHGLEIIVVDDGSTDDTQQILAGFGNRIITVRQNNAGAAAARNAGMAVARGAYLAFLDSDDLWLPEKIAKQITLFEADPELGMVHCGAERFDAAGKTLSVELAGLEGWVARELLATGQGLIAVGSSLMVRRHVAEEIGGFDSRLSTCEDGEFCYRVALRYRLGLVPEPLVRYRQHGEGKHLNVAMREKDMRLTLEKIFPSPDPSIQLLRKRAYGCMHRILAGCYSHRGETRLSRWHMLRSVCYDARNVSHCIPYPFRAALRALRLR
ncbi:MAG: glycosyltransferase [Acidobacteria bacterium]|nr:glycosyltransferase [Acidobacteriota bacterium]